MKKQRRNGDIALERLVEKLLAFLKRFKPRSHCHDSGHD